jgi:hypothetical protein
MNELKCIECGSNKRVEKWKNEIPLCKKHYLQLMRHGKVMKRTKYDANEIYIYTNHAEIGLYNRDCEEIARAIISLNKIAVAKKYKWSLDKNGYVSDSTNNVLLHRVLMNASKTDIIDHINGNTLDCRDENLRICNKSQNAMNSKMFSTNTSGIKGVSFDKSKMKWVAYIRVNDRNIYLGGYDIKEDAAKARSEAEQKYFKGYVRNNETA